LRRGGGIPATCILGQSHKFKPAGKSCGLPLVTELRRGGTSSVQGETLEGVQLRREIVGMTRMIASILVDKGDLAYSVGLKPLP